MTQPAARAKGSVEDADLRNYAVGDIAPVEVETVLPEDRRRIPPENLKGTTQWRIDLCPFGLLTRR